MAGRENMQKVRQSEELETRYKSAENETKLDIRGRDTKKCAESETKFRIYDWGSKMCRK